MPHESLMPLTISLNSNVNNSMSWEETLNELSDFLNSSIIAYTHKQAYTFK
jgi:hypothetical protein